MVLETLLLWFVYYVVANWIASCYVPVGYLRMNWFQLPLAAVCLVVAIVSV
jgi:hypothetical protein